MVTPSPPALPFPLLRGARRREPVARSLRLRWCRWPRTPGRSSTCRRPPVRYGGVVAVDDVSLSVRPGTVVGLIGPNGAGKTSVIDAITGFARSTGAIEVVRWVGRRPRPARAGEEGPGADLPGDRALRRPQRRGERERRRLRLEPHRARRDREPGPRPGGHRGARGDRPAGDLSQGQRQLVSIARACAAQPSVLLLDEPAAGLDSTESQWLGERIRAIADTGTRGAARRPRRGPGARACATTSTCSTSVG